jgi:hypothetical protein
MSVTTPVRLGQLVQDYVRAKWGRPGVTGSGQEPGRRLDPRLRERVDLLGNDDELLLEVPAEAVLQRIRELEMMAAAEDAGMSDAVDRVRAREEARMGWSRVSGERRVAHSSNKDRRRKRR